MTHSLITKIQSLFAEYVSKNTLNKVPAELIQRTAFEALWPKIYDLRMKGFSFNQITTILDECGLHLSTTTIEFFHEEMLFQHINASQTKINQSIIAVLGEEEFIELLGAPRT